MKKILALSLSLLFHSMILQGSVDESSTFTLSFESFHSSSSATSILLKVKIKAIDTTKFSDTFKIKSTGLLTGDTTVFDTTQLLPGDSILYTFSCNLDTSSMSRFFKPFYVNVLSVNSEETISTGFCSGKAIYDIDGQYSFYNYTDYGRLKRRYPLNADLSATYSNVHSIQQSDLSDTTTYDSLGEIYYRFYDSLPYAVVYKNCDTFNYDPILGPAPPLRRADGCGLGRKRFHANFTNLRLFNFHDRDPGAAVDLMNLWLANASVEIRVDRFPDQIVMKTRTDWEGFLVDENGSRNFNIDFCAGSSRNQVDIFLVINFQDPLHKENMRIKTQGSLDRSEDIVTQRETLFFSSTPNNIANLFGDEQNGEFLLSLNQEGTFEQRLESAGIAYTYLSWARRVVSEQLVGSGKENLPNCSVKIKDEAGSFYSGLSKTLHMSRANNDPDVIDEGVLYHEFGHFVAYHLHGISSWPNSGGTHVFFVNNRNQNLTMSEGFANGIEAILDRLLFNVDNEANGFEERVGFDIPIDDPNTPDPFPVGLNSPFLSEEYLATVMLDLWDGPNNFQTYGVQADPLFGDDNANGDVFDNVELSFLEILKPLFDNPSGINSIEDYFDKLTENSDCENDGAIRQVFNWNMTDNGNIPDNEMPLFATSKHLINPTNFNYTGFSVFIEPNGGLRFGENPITVSHNRAIVSLSTANNSFNFAAFTGLTTHRQLADDLSVENGASFELNGPNSKEFYNQQGGPNPNGLGDLIFSICPFTTLIIDNTSDLVIGSASPTRNAFVSVKHDSRIVSNGGTITINNNSTLTIEKGATLEIHPGTQIILNGSNAVLEIKGQVLLMNGATFSVQNGGPGTQVGKVIFEGDWNAPQLNIPRLINGNGSVQLNGNGATSTLVEVKGNQGLLVFNDIINFSITNAKVEMGEDAKLIVEASQLFSMDNVEVTALNTSLKHEGIHVWGCGDNRFTNMDVSFGKVGFNHYPDRHNRNGGSNCRTKLKLTNVNIANCDIGILSEGNDLVFKDGSITAFTEIGWKATAQSTMSLINDVNIESNTPNAQGIMRYGNGTVHIYNSKIHETRHGLYTEGGFIRPNCTEIYSTDGIGAWHEGRSTLGISKASLTRFTDNADQHILSRYNGVIQLKDGQNGFVNTSSNVGYWASLRPNQPFTSPINATTRNVDASMNYFSSTMTPQITQSPFGTENYLHHDNAGYAGSPIFSPYYYHILSGHNTGTNYSSTTSYLTHWGLNCPKTTSVTTGDWKDWTDEIDLNDGFGSPGGGTSVFYSIPTQTSIWGTSTLGDNYAAIASLSSNTSTDPKEILEKSIEILNIDFSSNTTSVNEVNASLRSLYKFATRAYMFAYSKYTQYHDSIDSTNLNSINSDLISISSTLISRANSNIAPWNDMYYTLCLNKSNVYRLNRDHDDAITELNFALTKVTDTTDIKYLNRWLCVNQNEKENRLDSVFSDSTQDVFTACYSKLCQGTYDTSAFEAPPGPQQLTDLVLQSSIENVVYPNPTKNGVWLETKSKINKISIFNSQGSKVNAPYLKVGDKWFINTSRLSNGVYILSFGNSKESSNQIRFTVLK